MERGNGKPSRKRRTHRVPRIDCLVDARAQVAQGLVWDDQTNRAFWIDSPVELLFAVGLTSGVVQSWSLPCAVAAIALCRDGRVAVVLLDGVHLFDLFMHDLHFMTHLDAQQAAGSVVGASVRTALSGCATPNARRRAWRRTPRRGTPSTSKAYTGVATLLMPAHGAFRRVAR